MSAEARLKQPGLTLPQVPAPVADYLPYRVAGGLLRAAVASPPAARAQQAGAPVIVSG
jgi:hypothetical protein